MEDAIPLAAAAVAEDVPVTVLQQAARRGIINGWTDGGVQYVSRAEVAVYLHHRADVVPSLAEPWASASRETSARYAGAYARLR
ncbi:MAG: hypothetical protein LC793_03385 [Thermomicrobia bacterium]|nr:hypothetical protein [Thermomicrobia bacterium]MCA1725223.1 hypothetical protein [Thermomicrobia bacterium]